MTQLSALYGARNTTANTAALMYSRAGILRSGASRSGYYATLPIATLNGVNLMNTTEARFGIVKGTLKSTHILGTQPATARFTMWVSRTGGVGTVVPQVGMALVLADGAVSNAYYKGTVVRVNSRSVRTPLGLQNTVQMFDVESTDGQWLLGRRTATKHYAAGQEASAIIRDLVQTFTTGFSTIHVQSGSPMVSSALSFKGAKVTAAITQVCQSISPNWNWRVDPNDDVHFALSESSQLPTPLVPGIFNYESLTFSSDVTQVRTRMLVEGGGSASTSPVAVGATTIPVGECGWYSATGGTFVSAGQGTLITYTGCSATSGPGNLTGVPASGVGSVTVALLQGDTLNVWVQRDDTAAQSTLAVLEGGDGIHEQYLNVPNGTIAQCQQQGDAELSAYSNSILLGTLHSYDRQMQIGKTLQIQLPMRNLSVNATIQQVVRTLKTPKEWQFDITFGTIFRNIVDVFKRAGQVQ